MYKVFSNQVVWLLGMECPFVANWRGAMPRALWPGEIWWEHRRASVSRAGVMNVHVPFVFHHVGHLCAHPWPSLLQVWLKVHPSRVSLRANETMFLQLATCCVYFCPSAHLGFITPCSWLLHTDVSSVTSSTNSFVFTAHRWSLIN